MAGWGIGLGGFATGIDSGVRSGISLANLASEKKDRELREAHLKNQEALQQKEFGLRQREFDEGEQQRQLALAATQRQQADETARRGVFAQGNDAYNAAVKAGTAKPNDAYDWFAHVYAPHIEQFYLAKGDVTNAGAFHKWSKDEDTQQQVRDMGKLIGTYHDAVQTGDFDALKKGMIKFYGDLPSDVTGGNKFTDLAVTKDSQGNVTGVAGTFTTADGKTVTQNFGNLGQFQQYLQGVANPATLYEHTMASQQQAAKFTSDIAEYAAKKGIDLKEQGQERGLGLKGKMPAERYADAQAALMKNSTTGAPPTDAQVRAYLAQQDTYAASKAPGLTGGAPTPSQQQPAPVIVDTKTGKVVGADGQPIATSPPQAPAGGPAASQPSPADIAAPPPTVTQPSPQNEQNADDQSAALGIPPSAVAPMPGISGSPSPPPSPQPQQAQQQPQAPQDQQQTDPMDGLDAINADRQAKGLPPLTVDQAAAMMQPQGQGIGLPM